MSILMLIAIVFIWFTIASIYNSHLEKVEDMPYTQFVECLKSDKIDTIYYNPQDEYMTITLINEDTKNMTREQRNEYKYGNKDKRRVLYPSYDTFRKEVLESGVNMQLVSSGINAGFLSFIGTIAFYIIMMLILFRIMSGQARGLKEEDLIQTSDVTFNDIIGHEEIIDDVKFITKLIKDPSKGDKIGAKLPKGLLFAGPPGTGKTLLAKAIAHEAGVPFLYQNASGFIELYVGLGAKRVRDLFKIARRNAPCILFIDEIDAIGGSRDGNKGTSENDQTINALLQEMDGFNPRDGIFVIAATNRPETLDEALVRSGRFDRQINVNPPRNYEIRKKLFEHYLSKFEVDDKVDIDNLAKQVSGFTGADIAMVCNEASIIAVMADKDRIDNDCIEEAIDKKLFHGNRSKTEAYEADRNIIAYHEAGHAVMSYLLGEPIARASIQSTTSGVGGAVFREDQETMFQTEEDLKNSILVAYAGRASEEIKFRSVTTGASNDITKATQIMLQYIEHLGFDKDFGLLDISVLSKEHLIDSDNITEKLSAMSNKLYAECFEKLKNNYDKVEILAQNLLKSETLTGTQIKNLLNQ